MLGMFIKHKRVVSLFMWFKNMHFRALHYENTPMQYTAIFHGCKNHKFQMKSCDNFLIFAQNIDCGYTLEPPHPPQ